MCPTNPAGQGVVLSLLLWEVLGLVEVLQVKHWSGPVVGRVVPPWALPVNRQRHQGKGQGRKAPELPFLNVKTLLGQLF